MEGGVVIMRGTLIRQPPVGYSLHDGGGQMRGVGGSSIGGGS